MDNKNEEQQVTEELIQPLNTEDIQSVGHQTKTRPNKINYLMTGLISILAVIATLLSLYTMHINRHLQKQIADEHAYFSSQFNELNQSQSDTQAQLNAKTANMQQNQSDVENKLDGLKEQVHTAMNQRMYQNQDWLLLKARYYLELAQINSHWSDNLHTSIVLLQEADDLLKQQTEPKLFDVRQAIAKEINQIKSLPIVDIAGLLSQLDAAQITVGSLSALTNPSEDGHNPQNKNSQNPSSPWRARLQDSIGLLQKLVVIRRNNENVQPLLSPLFESILRESIRLNLQEAQWAILNNNQTIYQLALKQAITNLKRLFNEKAPNTAGLIKQLTELQQVKLTSEKPIPGTALPLLNEVINRNDDKPVNSKGENRS